ncbi:MAG: site-specific integrase [Chitinophagaceae bacterium]|nr:MAG: site-specific integrase [Chitinophagaceae bacterium]
MDSQNQTFSIDFITRISKKDKSLASIYARITIDGAIKEISLHQSIPKEKWDHKGEVVNGKTPEARAINEHIEKVRFRLRETYLKLQGDDKILTAESVKDAYLGRNSNKKGHTLCELIKYHDKINRGELAGGTMKNYVTTEEYIKLFLKHQFDREDIFLSELDFQFITDFEYYIRNNPIKKWDPCQGNGLAKHLERVKKMVKWSKKLKWIKENPFEDYTITKKKAKRKKLTVAELYKIQTQKFTNPTLAFVQDLFIFSCYTGLAHADVLKFSGNDIELDSDGNPWITTYRQKSEELSPIPLLETAISLINKYKNDPRSIQKGTIFPPKSNQDVNRNLKIIGEVCGIKKEINFHLARHTFATAVTLKNGVPIETVSKMLGHKKLSTTMIYAEVDEEKIEEDMTDIEVRLNKRMEKISKQPSLV